MANLKIGQKVGKTLLKTLTKFGLRPDDIVEMIEEIGIDNIIAEQLQEIKTEENEKIVIFGYADEDNNFKFTAAGISEIKTESGTVSQIGKQYPFDFFGQKQVTVFTITGMIGELIKLAFSSLDKPKQKKVKKLKK